MIQVTGRELIMYILTNGLENEPINTHEFGFGFMTIDEAAAKLSIGPATVQAMVQEKKLKSVRFGDELYIVADVTLEL